MPPAAAADQPHVERIAVVPHERILDRHARQQLAVLAYSSDGSAKDVTHSAHFETSTPEMAEITPSGLVTTRGPAGDVAVMVRYQGYVDVFRGLVPLAANLATTPSPRNFIDEIVFAKLKLLGISPAADCDDATFVRRVALDIAGRLPSASRSAGVFGRSRRRQTGQVDRQAVGLQRLCRFFCRQMDRHVAQPAGERALLPAARLPFTIGSARVFRSNKPYDQFVRELVAASGDMAHNPPVVWYRTLVTSNQQLEDTAQLFLGQRIQCARCHHHPYEKWAQQDYYGFAAFFAQVQRKNSLELRLDEPRVFHGRGEARATDPRTGTSLRPPAWEASRSSFRLRPIRGGAGRLDGRSPKPVFCPLAGQSILEALFQPGPGRAGRRHAGHQSGHESRVARSPGEIVCRQPLRSEAVDSDHLPVATFISSAPSRTNGTWPTRKISPGTIPADCPPKSSTTRSTR